MIEEKDYLMRLIRNLVEMIRLMLTGETHGPTQYDLTEMLADVSGIPLPLLEKTDPVTLKSMLNTIDDANRLAIISAILTQKAKITDLPERATQWNTLAQSLAGKIDYDQIISELKPLLKQLGIKTRA